MNDWKISKWNFQELKKTQYPNTLNRLIADETKCQSTWKHNRNCPIWSIKRKKTEENEPKFSDLWNNVK